MRHVEIKREKFLKGRKKERKLKGDGSRSSRSNVRISNLERKERITFISLHVRKGWKRNHSRIPEIE